MAAIAEIERDYPERLAALQEAMGTVSLAEFGENLTAGRRNVRPAISLGNGWIPATDTRFQLRPPRGPGLDPLVFGPHPARPPELTDLTGPHGLGARLLEWARQVIAGIGRALRPFLDLLRKLAPVATAITQARRERMSSVHREYARRQRARRRRR